MTDMMTEFLTSGRERAAVVIAEQGVARSAEEHKKAEHEANVRALEDMVGRELSPVLDVLRGLPEKDGKRFLISISYPELGATAAECAVSVSYQQPPTGHSRRHYDDDDSGETWEPKVSIALALDNGTLKGNVYQHSIKETSRHNRRVETSSFDDIRRELGLGIGTFAPDRVDEIQKAVVSGPPPAEVKPEPKRGWHWPRFLN